MIPVDTGVYTQTPVHDGLYAQKFHTHTVNGPNLTASTLSGKTKVKIALEAHKWDNRICKSTISRVYVGKTLKLDFTRKNPSERQTIQQKISALSENPILAEYTRENLENGLYAQTLVNVGLYSKRTKL